MEKNNVHVILFVLAFVFSLSTSKVFASGLDSIEGIIRSTTGTAFGVGVGPAIGGLRGLVTGGIKGTQTTAEALGDKDGIAQNTVGAFTGGLGGAVLGTVSGVAMGVYNGVRYGWKEPWTPHSFSAGGTDLLDYDPFSWE